MARGSRSLASLLMLAAAGTLVPSLSATPARAQTYTLGVDVSHWQEENGNTIDWQKVADSGHVYAWHKATEGATYVDDEYAGNRTDAGNVGIPFGGYHFARPSGGSISAAQSDAQGEAQHFLEIAVPAPGDLIPVLDLEASGGLPPRRLIAWTDAWLDHVTAALGVQPMIYASPNFWTTYMNDTTTFALEGFPLWIAHYTADPAPRVPAANWGGNGWSFWQWTSQARVPGIVGNADEDRFLGSDLTPYKIPGAPLPTPTPDPATPPVNQTAPTITGRTEVGSTLQASSGTWGGSQPQSFSYSWFRCDANGLACTGINDGGTGPSYTLRPADYGQRVMVTVTATNSAGSAQKESAPSDVVTDTVAPRAPQMKAPVAVRTLATQVRVSWNSSESGVTGYDVRSRATTPDDGFGDYAPVLDDTTQRETTVDVAAGSTTCFSARAIDQAGNQSGWSVERCTAVPLDDRSLKAAGFTRGSGSAFFLRTISTARRPDASLTATRVRVRDLYLVASRCSGCGKVTVSFDGKRLATIDLGARRSLHQRIIPVAAFSRTRIGMVRIRVISRNLPVKVDGLLLSL